MTGSLQEKNGKYYAVLNVYVDGKRKPKWIYTGLSARGNKKAAEKFLENAIENYESDAARNTTAILYCDYVIRWLEASELRLDKITYQGYASIVNAHVVPYFRKKGIKLIDVTRDDLQQYINDKHRNGNLKTGKGLSPKSLRTHKIILQQTFIEAIRSGLIRVSPCQYLIMPKLERREPNFYSAEQLNELFSAIRDEQLAPLIFITAQYGLRRSEVLGLKWDSIDYENNTITIKHTVVRYSDVVEKDSTKTKSSYRSFPLTEAAIEIFKNQKLREKENALMFGKAYVKNDYIFKWDDGRTYNPIYVTEEFNRILKRHEFEHIRFHDLRHSCASLLIANGMTLKDIQEWLGHADIQTTANIYAHLDVNRKKKIADSLSNSLKFENFSA